MKRYMTLVLMIALMIMVTLGGFTDQALARGRGNHNGLLMDPILIEDGYVSGVVIGDPDDPVRAYRGIPYAAPPVGDLRWKAPQPVVPWDGILECTTFPADPVAFAYGSSFLPPTEQDEDCLTLNIITPAKRANENLPVMVFFHGGGLAYGSGNEDWVANRTQLAEQGVVYVNVNERLGALGLLCHPLLNEEAGHSGNYLFMDLIQALQWVQANIAAFGGDPDNVTIFGQSGGGTKTNMMMMSPLASGLFHRAICMSGGGYSGINRTEEEAYAQGEALFAALRLMGYTVDTLADARAVPWKDVWAAAEGLSFGQVVDGYVLPDQPQAIYEAGEQNAVPLMVTAAMGELSASWPLPWFLGVLQSQWSLGIPSYAGMWDQVPANWRELGGTCVHAMDLPYVFGDLKEDSPMWTLIMPYFEGIDEIFETPVEFGNEDRTISKQSSAIFAQFAKTGDPSVKKLIRWPTWDPSKEKYLYINDTLTIKKGFSTVTP